MSTSLEQFARGVAADIAGPEPQASEANALISFLALIELVMTIVMTLLQNCPKNQTTVLERIRKPGFVFAARFRAHVQHSCDCCAADDQWRKQSGAITRAMRARAQSMTDAELRSVVFESQNDWLAV
jgi:hypothetical protein